jgi:hypothetical protein
MSGLTFTQVRTDVTAFVQGVQNGDQLDVAIVASLLVVVLVLALASIWRGRRRRSIPVMTTPSTASGFTRWLTPMGMKSIPAEQGVVARPRRKSGANKTIKVSTPVSKVATRSLRGAGADPLEIARKTGLARDAVVMMMANANPQARAKQQSAAKAPTKAPVKTAANDRAMSAPGPYTTAQRAVQAPASNSRTVGTQFNARLS